MILVKRERMSAISKRFGGSEPEKLSQLWFCDGDNDDDGHHYHYYCDYHHYYYHDYRA